MSDKEVIISGKHEKTLQNDKKSKPGIGFVIIIASRTKNWY